MFIGNGSNRLYIPDRFKQFAWLPGDILLVSKDEDTGLYEDMRQYGGLGYFALEDGRKEIEDGNFIHNEAEVLSFGWISSDMYGDTVDNIDADEWKLIPAYRCPKCGNKMTVLPFKEYSEAVYRCVICGENYPVKL